MVLVTPLRPEPNVSDFSPAACPDRRCHRPRICQLRAIPEGKEQDSPGECSGGHLPHVSDEPEEIDTLRLDQIEVKSFVGGRLVKGGERKDG